MRYAVAIFSIAALFSLILAGFDCLSTPPEAPPPPFKISRTEFAVGNVSLGTQLLHTSVANPSNEPRRILGINGQCSDNSCFGAVQEAPIIIPPGGTLNLDCELLVTRPGPIDAEIKIYLEENGIRTVTLRVTGTAVEAPRVPK